MDGAESWPNQHVWGQYIRAEWVKRIGGSVAGGQTEVVQYSGDIIPSHQTITIPIQHLKCVSQFSNLSGIQPTQCIASISSRLLPP